METPLVSRVGQVSQPMRIEFFHKKIPVPEKDQVVIQIKSTAVCGSDLHIFKGRHPSAPLPVTIGHEFSGDVVLAGEEAGIPLGTRVTVEPCLVCGRCEACRHGDYSYCEDISFTYRRGDGAMADYITVQAAHVYPLPEHLSYAAGALIEPLSVAVHAVRRAQIQLGETVLILGAGAIGILVAAVCRRNGASRVIISDYSPYRLDMAMAMGATDAVNPGREDYEETLSRLTDGKGVDKSFECVGLESTFIQAMTALKRGGLATVVGIFEQPDIRIPAGRFVSHEIKVQGAQSYCWDFPVALKMSGQIDLEKLITHTFSLDNLQQALEICLDRNVDSIKVLLRP